MNVSPWPGGGAFRLSSAILILACALAACEGVPEPSDGGGAAPGPVGSTGSSVSSVSSVSSAVSASSASAGGAGGAGGLPDLTAAVGSGGGEGGCAPASLPEDLPCVDYAPLPCEAGLEAGDVLSFAQCQLYCVDAAALYGCSVQEIGASTLVACETCPLAGAGGSAPEAP